MSGEARTVTGGFHSTLRGTGVSFGPAGQGLPAVHPIKTNQFPGRAIPDVGSGWANNSIHDLGLAPPDVSDFLDGARAAIVVEDSNHRVRSDGVEILDSGEYNKCLLHL
jgi:hypothetical protein